MFSVMKFPLQSGLTGLWHDVGKHCVKHIQQIFSKKSRQEATARQEEVRPKKQLTMHRYIEIYLKQFDQKIPRQL